MTTKEIISTDIDPSVRRLFSVIVSNGTAAFRNGSILFKSNKRNLLENMICHFEKKEEYEKCAFLKIIQEQLHIPNAYEQITD